MFKFQNEVREWFIIVDATDAVSTVNDANMTHSLQPKKHFESINMAKMAPLKNSWLLKGLFCQKHCLHSQFKRLSFQYLLLPDTG